MKKILLIGAGLLLAGFCCAAIGGMALLRVSQQGVSSRAPSESELQLLSSVDSLQEFIEIPGDRELCESYIAKTNLDGSLELEYGYDTDKDPDADEFLFFKCEAEPCSTVEEAKEVFSGNVAAYRMGIGLVSGREMVAEDLFSLGDENFSSIVTQDGQPLGNIVVARRGSTVHSMLIYGLYFDEREPLESVMQPVMQ